MYYNTPKVKIAYWSYGYPIPNKLINYLGEGIYTSIICIQSYNSKACGYYCLAILFIINKKVSFESIIFRFNENKWVVLHNQVQLEKTSLAQIHY